MSLSHFDEGGRARMVDVGNKEDTARLAVAEGRVTMKPETLRLALDKKAAKGDPLETARLAGIMAAKKTPDLIPLCHPIPIHSVEVDITAEEDTASLVIRAKVTTVGKTGVEMDAMTAVAVAGLTVYDMLKSVDKDIVISGIRLVEKTGGKSGHYKRSSSE